MTGSKKKSIKKSPKRSPKKKKSSLKRHSKFVSSFTRKDGIYVKSHFRDVGGKREK